MLSHSLFFPSYVFRADSKYLTSSKIREGGLLILVPKSLYGFKRRYDLGTTK